MKISVVSGGFDPIHSGHISYLEKASILGDKLYVCLNSDEWLCAKKGKPFMSFKERKTIIEAMRCVDKVIDFDDSDGSCIQGLLKIKSLEPDAEIIFCNGGDRTQENTPESCLSDVKLVFGVGGSDKKNSSSSILQGWTFNTEKRVWGAFKTLLTRPNLKLKELIINPHQGISFQLHQYRSEVWFVFEGKCRVYLQPEGSKIPDIYNLNPGDLLEIPMQAKHQIVNEHDISCRIIEIQSGQRVDEKDIERFFHYPEVP